MNFILCFHHRSFIIVYGIQLFNVKHYFIKIIPIKSVVYGSALERGDMEKNEAVLKAAKKLGKKLAG